MDYVVTFLLGTLISWILLLIVVPISQKLADFSFPPWPETLWKLAVIAGATNATNMALTPVHWILALLGGPAVFFILMYKWFDIDFFGAVIIVVVHAIVSRVVSFYIVLLFLTR